MSEAGVVVDTAVGAVVSGMPHAVTVIATAHMTTPTKVFTARYTVFPSLRVTAEELAPMYLSEISPKTVPCSSANGSAIANSHQRLRQEPAASSSS